MVISEILKTAEYKLKNSGIKDSYNEALILLTYALDCTKTYIFTHMDAVVPDNMLEIYYSYVNRRTENTPAAYISGKAWFMSLEFNVNDSVLIPRPETEGLVERVRGIIKNHKKDEARVLDLCTGSGCIGISIAFYNKKTPPLSRLLDCWGR